MVDRDEPPVTLAPAPTGQTIRLNIGGGGGSGSSTPPRATPVEKKDGALAGPAKTIKLNIGGSSSASSAAPAVAAKDKAFASAASPKLTEVVPSKPAATTTAPAPLSSATVSKAKEFNFTSDKSKTNADAVLNDTLAVADQETLKDLYGDGDVVDPNGTVSFILSLHF
jgi:peptide chain release factor subunit 3